MKIIIKASLFAISLLLLASCSKTPGSTGMTGDSEGGLSAQGLGQLNNQFAGQDEGESYTTKAPHNQVYLFAFDDSTLASKYHSSLNAQAAYLKAHQGAKILLAGHTDERGSREYNVALGERRAKTVSDLIRMAGVNPNQIRVVSYGKERPANFDHDDAAHRQNRRVELIYEATR